MKQFAALQHPAIAHGFFGRKGGFSTGLYSSLNCGLGSDDEAAMVHRNRTVVAQALSGEAADILTAHQVHSAEALVVDKLFEVGSPRPKVDGLVTTTPGLILGTLTADCGPVLFADVEAGVIGVAHAGWKGALAGITDATVLKMESVGAKREQIVAVLGPMISQAAYEVGAEFRAKFLAAMPENAEYFIASQKVDHYMFDLPHYLSVRLHDFGVGTVIDSRLCTYTLADEYFSYRRTTHAQEPDYGRQIAAITLKAKL